MNSLTFNEFVYYGVLVGAAAVYLPLYIKIRKEMNHRKRKSTRWGIVASFALIGIIGVLAKMVAWLPALLSSGVVCLIAYYIVFIKYTD